jgi:phage terminase Nu1 subunit (DNA packaging protein)
LTPPVSGTSPTVNARADELDDEATDSRVADGALVEAPHALRIRTRIGRSVAVAMPGIPLIYPPPL